MQPTSKDYEVYYLAIIAVRNIKEHKTVKLLNAYVKIT